MEASVVATAASMGMPGVAVARPGNEQDEINSPMTSIITVDRIISLKKYLNFNL
jgi:hypothetical protein